jgi:hypothetical protein
MKLQRSRIAPLCAAIFLAFGLVLSVAPARATHVSDAGVPQSFLRTPLGADQGYLEYALDPAASRRGQEWTGWMDTRHPSLAGPRDQDFGYDRSDHFVGVRTTTLVDSTGGPAMPDIPRDFAFANRAFVQQAGLSVLETAHRTLGSSPPAEFTFPLDVPEEMALAANRNAGAPTLDAYYATSLASDAFGETIVPSQGLGPPAVFVADFQAAPPPLPPVPVRPDTFSHEVAHFLTDGRAIHAENGSPDEAHSSDPFNLLAGSNRQIPSGGGFGLLEVGPPRVFTPGGPIVDGGKDQVTTTPDDPSGSFPASSSQVERIYASAAAGNGAAPYIATNENAAAGHRVDWDFVTDHLPLEGVPGRADDHPGADRLSWEIGFTTASDHAAHDHADWESTLLLPDFVGPSFRFVDVFSLDAIFSDADVTQFGVSSFQALLDYVVVFRAADGGTADGVPIEIFIQGWTDSSNGDGVVRWESPIDAVGVFVRALTEDGHDGIAQIDAVIASQVPEPGTGALVVAGMLLLAMLRRRASR